MSGARVDASTLDANLERILSLEQTTSAARAQTHEALCNLLQSRTELSTSGSMLSAATRAAMGKRGIAQLEATKGLLEMASDTAALVRNDATALREEVRSVVATRDAAVAAVAEAEATSAETCERVEQQGAAAMIASNEATTRAEQKAASAVARAEAAELRAEQAERGFVEAEKARAEAASALATAAAAKDGAAGRLSTVEAQLAREREVLAKVMAENVLFVKQLEFAEAEKQRALDEKEALRVAWREQTESWFASAASELQTRLLSDWGASDGLQLELQSTRQARAIADAEYATQLAALEQSESKQRAEAQHLSAEREAWLAEREDLSAKLEGVRSQLKAAQTAGQQLLAQAEVRAQQVDELKTAEKEWRERGEAEGKATLALRADFEARAREAARLQRSLEETEERLAISLKVNERVRAESADEHGRMLEAQAKLETLQEHHDTLVRQHRVLTSLGQTSGVTA